MSVIAGMLRRSSALAVVTPPPLSVSEAVIVVAVSANHHPSHYRMRQRSETPGTIGAMIQPHR